MTEGVRGLAKLNEVMATDVQFHPAGWARAQRHMSTALLESPVQTSSSQLCFVWSETEESPAGPRKARPSVATPATNRAVVGGEVGSGGALTQPVGRHAGPAGVRRGTGEVRLGAVMIKLLKRYGITDEEIAEGLANYAKKTCRSVAS